MANNVASLWISFTCLIRPVLVEPSPEQRIPCPCLIRHDVPRMPYSDHRNGHSTGYLLGEVSTEEADQAGSTTSTQHDEIAVPISGNSYDFLTRFTDHDQRPKAIVLCRRQQRRELPLRFLAQVLRDNLRRPLMTKRVGLGRAHTKHFLVAVLRHSGERDLPRPHGARVLLHSTHKSAPSHTQALPERVPRNRLQLECASACLLSSGNSPPRLIGNGDCRQLGAAFCVAHLFSWSSLCRKS